MAWLMDRRLYEPMYEDADLYDPSYGLLSPYADAGMQVPQVQPQVQPNYQPLSQQLTNFWTQNQIDPNIRGINRADELAQILSHFGISDLSQVGLKATQRELPGEWVTGLQNDNEVQQWVDPRTETQYQLTYGDKTFGDLGGFDTNGNPVYLNTPPQQYLQQIGENRYRIAGSSAGKGVTDFVASFTPEGKLQSIVPQWRSSSDWPAIRQALLIGGGLLAGGMGLESLLGGGGAAGAGAGLSAADAAYALGMGETAVGGALAPAAAGGSALANLGSVTQLGTPFAELGAVGLPAAEVGLPSLLAPETIMPEAFTVTGSRLAAAAPSIAPAVGAGATVAAPAVMDSFRPSQNYGDGMTGNQTSVYDSVVDATGSKTAADLAANAVGPVSSAFDWLKANPQMGRLLFSAAGGLLSASGGSSGGPGGYKDSGYRPTVSRGGWQPSVAQRSMPTTPLSLNLPTTGQPNSGLWRYGLLGG